jgi:flagellar hook-basal body complex protein FliE
MTTTNIEQVLSQIRTMSAMASGGTEAQTDTSGVSFNNLLKDSINEVNESQLQATELKQAFELGESDVNLAEVMVAIQKSSVSFEAMVQVRNKLIDAYKEVMNMPI